MGSPPPSRNPRTRAGIGDWSKKMKKRAEGTQEVKDTC